MQSKWLNLLVLVTLLAGLFPTAVLAQAPISAPTTGELHQEALDKIDPQLLGEVAAKGQSDYFIWMMEEADLSLAYKLATKQERGRFVFETLVETAERTQAPLRAYLDQQGLDYRPYYIVNRIFVKGGNYTTLLNIASRPDVARVTPNNQYQLDLPIPQEEILGPTAIEWNVSFINADDVWAMGYTGEGIVLAGNDTGLAWTHPAIQPHYRGWDGATVDHNYNWWDATGAYPLIPNDGHGHGTHTTGTMVGDDGGANQIGVSPGATTIHCKNMTDAGGGSDQTFLDCFEFDLAPWDLTGANPNPDLAPHAVNNSWGYAGGGDNAFRTAIANLQAAGILIEVSAGNEGPTCSTLRSPGDYQEVLTTGSVGIGSGSLPGTLTGSSSRGPSSLDGNYFPDIMAPGQNIRSALPGNTYAAWGGTSMAGPHATALIGLMWQACPNFVGNVEDTIQIIRDTAVPLTGQTGSNCGGDYITGPNNDWGMGTIDALAAVNAVLAMCGDSVLEGTVTDAFAPIVGARVEATDGMTQTLAQNTDANGFYQFNLFAGTYTVTVAAFGYQPAEISGVVVNTGLTTTQDVELEQATWYTVDGYVTDSLTGWPLYAQMVIAGYPGDSIWTDPVTGYYSISLPEGIEYTFNVTAWVAGYLPEAVVVGPLTGDEAVDVELTANALCESPGYTPVYVYTEDFEGGNGGYVAGGTASSWAYGTPTNGPGAAYSGANVWATNLTANYNNSEASYLTSPAIDLSAAAGQGVQLSWWQWLQTESGYDYARLEVSNDGGTTWAAVYGPVSGNVNTAWAQRQVILDASYAVANFRLRFNLTSDGSVAGPGWYVDDIAIVGGCAVPADGGLVVGNVYDFETNAPLVGALVENEIGEAMLSRATPDDPAVDDGFYTLFTPSGDQVFTATMNLYGPDIQTVTVVDGDTVQQDFYLPVGNLTVDPTSLHATVDLGATEMLSFTLENVGSGPVSWEIVEQSGGFAPAMLEVAVVAPTQPRQVELAITALASAEALPTGTWLPTGAVELVLDDGVSEDALGLTSGEAFVWFNRFTPNPADFPFYLDQVSVLFRDSANVGDQIQIVIWEDPDGDPNNGATLLHTQNVVVQYNDGTTWNNYALETPVMLLTSGDVLIGLVNRSGASGGTHPAAIDQTASQGRSWVGAYTTGVPDPPTLPTDDLWGTVDSFGFAGNWMIRGSGLTGSPDVPWLSEDPTSGALSAGDSRIVEVTFDAGVPEITQPGDYYAQLRVVNDTPYGALAIPVTMTVIPPDTYGKVEGTVIGLGYCDTDPAPLANAEVFVENSLGLTWTLSTDAAGEYTLWLDAADSPVTMTVTADGHAVGQESGVIIVGQGTTTVDFDLRWLQPCVTESFPVLEATLDLGMTATFQAEIWNFGGGPLNFEFKERETGYVPLSLGLPAFEGELPVSAEPPSAGPAPRAPQLTGAQPTFPLDILANEPAFAIDVYPGENLVYIPDTMVPGTWNVVGSVAGTAYFAGDFVGGDFSKLYAINYDTNSLYSLDTATGVATLIGPSTPSGGESWAGATGTSDGTLYASSTNCSGGSTLYTVDLATGAASAIGNTGISCLIDIAINADGEMYGVDIVTDQLYQIDPATGAASIVGSLGADANYAQGMDFEEVSGVLYWAAYTTQGEMRIIDTTTGASTLVGVFPGGAEVDCLAFPTGGASDVPWLHEDPITGTLPADTWTTVDIIFDASVIGQPGDYYATLMLDSNDPFFGRFTYPVTMHVEMPPDFGKLEGLVSGLGYCDSESYPLVADVLIEGSNGMTWTLGSDALGYFTYWLDSDYSPYTVTAMAANHSVGYASVNVTAGATATVALDLRWLQPCVAIEHPELAVQQDLGLNTTLPFTITNSGAAPLTFEFKKAAGDPAFIPMAGDDVLVVAYDTAAATAMENALAANGYTFVRVTRDVFQATPVDDLMGYAAVFYAGGYSGDSWAKAMAYLDAGGRLLIADNDLGYGSGSTIFYQQYLQATYLTDGGSRGVLTGVDIMAGINPDINLDPYPDDFTVGAEGVQIFIAPSGNSAGARIERNGYKAIYLSWDFDDTAAVADETAIIAAAMGYLAGADVPWLFTDPITGTVGIDGDYSVADITFDAFYVGEAGMYLANLTFKSNDPGFSSYATPVTMEVTLPDTFGSLQGWVNGLGYCDTETYPLEGAQVLIETSTGLTLPLETDALGYFGWAFDASHSPLTVTVTADGHAIGSLSGVPITAQETSEVFFDLRWLQPCVVVEPVAMEHSFTSLGMSTTIPMTLTNYGAVSTTFEIKEQDDGFVPLAGEDVLVVAVDTAAATAMEAGLAANGYTYLRVDRATFEATPVDALINDYGAVFYAGNTTGNAWATAIAYLDAGGRLLIADNDLGFSHRTTVFYQQYLQATYVSDTGADGVLTGVDIMAGINPDISPDPYPDDFTVGAEGVQIFIAPSGNSAGVRVDRNGYKAIYLSWDFDDTAAVADEAAIMGVAAGYLISAGDVPWLDESLTFGDLPADGGAVVVDVTLDSGAVLDFGEYKANLRIQSADPLYANRSVPVTMMVLPGASYGQVHGTVLGVGYCDGPEALVGAEVFIEGAAGFTATVLTDADGYYYKWLDSVENPYTLTVSYLGHATEIASVEVVAQAVVVQDFSLQWLQPIVDVAPAALSDGLIAPDTALHALTITNYGYADLDFSVSEVPSFVSNLTVGVTAADVAARRTATVVAGGALEIEPALTAQIAANDATGYLIYFRETADLSAAYGMDWEARGQFVVKALQATAERTQANVRAYLDAQGVDYQAFWIDNVIVVKSSNAVTFNGLLNFNEIAALRTRRQPMLYEPVESSADVSNAPTAIEPNISWVNADDVWALGYQGEGMIVANIDTGVRYTHQALVNQYRGNQGGGVFDHNYNWWDPYDGTTSPNDFHSHGSHTMGTMVGDDGAGNQIGMAPAAQWIACQSFEGTNADVDASLLECGQFMAAPWDLSGANPNPNLRPHAVNNSWGDCGTTFDTWYDGVLDAWLAAGIYPVFSNGNASNCGYSSPPGLNTVGNPARSGRVSGIGSTGQANGQYATHSNWGPTDNPDTINPTPGYENLKPQFVAPGVNIRSAYRDGDTAYGTMGGTSMSAPHVTALVALMWQSAPCLLGDYAATETLIEQTATPIPYNDGSGVRSPNFATGWGEINAYAAVQEAMNYCGTDWYDWVDTTPVSGTIPAGEMLNLDVTFTCNVTHTLEAQPLQGILRINHNDPCQAPIEIDLTLFCYGANPTPMWNKAVQINGVLEAPVVGPHIVRSGDEVVVVDYVGASYHQPITATLTESWGAGLELVSVDTAGVGVLIELPGSLTWDLEGVAANQTYPITKTFAVAYGEWISDTLAESFYVENADVQLADVNVVFELYQPALSLSKEGPAEALVGDIIPITLTISSDGAFVGATVLTDVLPAGMTYAGNLLATFGTAWEDSNTIYHTAGTPSVDVVVDGSFEGGSPNPVWAEASTNFGTPLCTAAACGTGGGTGPFHGNWWVWFGGIAAYEAGSVAQDITIPSGVAMLSFWLEIPSATAPATMTVYLDGDPLFTVSEADAGDYPSYAQVEVDVSAYADGGVHTLLFHSISLGGGTTNFFVDQVMLAVGDPLPASIEITFDVLVEGLPGDVIQNLAELDWAEDFTNAILDVLVVSPVIYMDEHEMVMVMPADEVLSHLMGITNTGNMDLHWTLSENPEVAWLSEVPTQGTTVPLGDSWVDITMDTAGLPVGVYTTTLVISTNDPNHPYVLVPVTLTVEIATFTLDVIVEPAGSGVVEIDPDLESYLLDDMVTLTATAEPGWLFVGWSGDIESTDEEIVITIAGDTVITATFEAIPYTLDVNIVGEGEVLQDPDQETYSFGDVVSLTAIADPGWTFIGWSGDVESDEAEISVTIEGDTVITATFEQDAYTLEVIVEPSGSGVVAIDPEQETYVYGDVVTLTATAELGWLFVGWSGDIESTDEEIVITIAGDTVITATFEAIPYTLDVTVAPAGSGEVLIDPDQATYAYGEVVTLTAVPTTGWEFAGWSGDINSLENPLVIEMDADYVLVANFIEEGTCVDVTGVTLSLVTEGDLYAGDALQFSAAIAPLYASTPFTYTLNGGAEMTATTNPFNFSQSFLFSGTYEVEIAVWNCAMVEPVSDTLEVTVITKPVTDYFIYLPLVMRLTP